MTALTMQQLTIPDCEETVQRAYYAWGQAADSGEAAWEDASPEQQAAVSSRGYLLYDGWPVQGGDEIGATECYVSTGINSRVILNDVVRLIYRADSARPLLNRIPDGTRLE